jgi:hypothetical protein
MFGSMERQCQRQAAKGEICTFDDSLTSLNGY